MPYKAQATLSFFLSLALSFSLGLFVFPLYSYASQEANPEYAPRIIHKAEEEGDYGKPVSGDMLVVGLMGEPTNMLPFMTSDNISREVSSNFYVAPLKFDKDLEVVPFAAEKFEVLEDGLLLSFKLHENIRWSDGVELTAEDVEFTYQLMIDSETPTAYAGDFKAVKSFTVTDKYSFEVRYEKPFPRSLSTWMSAIMPKHALKNLRGHELRSSPLLRKPLSAGPYLLDQWQAGSFLRLKANPDYFEGKANIDHILYRIIPDSTTLFLELKAGKIDILGSLSSQQYLYQTNNKSFRSKFNIYQWLQSMYIFMGYNLKSPIFSDLRVRQAIAHAVDKEELLKGVFFGQGVSTIGPFMPGTWAYNNEIKDYTHDRAKALELLAEAGWLKGKNDLLYKEGHPFTFTLLVNQGNETRIKAGVLLQHQLKKIGIDVKIRTVEWAAFLKNFVDKGFFDALILGWTIPAEPDSYDVWHSSRAGGGLNFVSYANKEVDELLELGRGTFDRDKRKEYYYRMQEILHEEQPYLFLFVPYSFAAVDKRFKGIEPAPAGIGYNRDEWWVPLDQQRYNIKP